MRRVSPDREGGRQGKGKGKGREERRAEARGAWEGEGQEKLKSLGGILGRDGEKGSESNWSKCVSWTCPLAPPNTTPLMLSGEVFGYELYLGGGGGGGGGVGGGCGGCGEGCMRCVVIYTRENVEVLW